MKVSEPEPESERQAVEAKFNWKTDIYSIRMMKVAAGVAKRAEKFYLWRSRQMALAWLRALRDGCGRKWLDENREKLKRVLEAEGWFEPMLTGEALMAGCEKVFEKKKAGLVKQ